VDAVATFLNGQDKGDLYVELPIGLGRPDMVCKLKKVLYGLKASPAIWYETQALFLKRIGFVQSTYDPALFLRRSDKGTYI
jgi:Reverse transcriptase (RNA-dependent DNA polymerase)